MINKTEEIIKEENIKNEDDAARFRGHYVSAVGRRKTSVATIRIYKKGAGIITVNGKKINEYFKGEKANVAKQPLKLAGHMRDLNISINVKGGGSTGQLDSVRLALSRGLALLDDQLKPALRAKKLLTRDSRRKERKKPGLKKARRAPQWAKR